MVLGQVRDLIRRSGLEFRAWITWILGLKVSQWKELVRQEKCQIGISRR